MRDRPSKPGTYCRYVPSFVIVCGPPASGKSLLASHLGTALAIPVISKDLVKEPMMDHLGGEPPVGAASFDVLFAVAKELLRAGTSFVLEAAFFRDQSPLQELARMADAIVVNVECDIDVLEQRYLARHASRLA